MMQRITGPAVVVALLVFTLPASATITMDLNVAYGDCGLVTVDGGAWEDGEPITWIDWEWGDGISFTRSFPASHQYEANGTYEVRVTAHGDSGATLTEVLAVVVTNAEEPGCEVERIHLSLGEPEYLPCGEVRINGSAWSEVGQITSIQWDWDDGSTMDSWFPAEHDYEANGTFTVVATAYDDTGDSRDESVVVGITSAAEPGCDLALQLHPKELYLRDGQTGSQLRVELREAQNRPVDPSTVSIVWSSEDPDLVQVSSTGWVESHGFGRATVRATLETGRFAEAEVHAGHLRTAPYFQYLTLGHQPNGQVWPDMANADGTPVNLSGRDVEFLCNGCEPGQPLQLESDGQFVAVETIEADDPLPLGLMAVVDGQWAQNWGFVHVDDTDYGLELRQYESHNTTIVSPATLDYLDLDAMLVDMAAAELFEQAFGAQRTLTDGVWYGGGRQVLTHYVSPDIGGRLPPCGGSGNPIQVGSRFDAPWLSCFWYEPEPGLISPRWGIFFHELGHNFTWTAFRFADFADAGDGVSYSEGLATAASMYSCEAILRLGAAAGVTPEIARSLEASGLCWRHSRVGDALAGYVAAGADYQTLNPDIVDDILAVLIDEHGYGVLYRLFSIFVPRGDAYPFPMTSAAEQATLFALALDEATGADLKARFRDDWGFPIEDQKWALMEPLVRQWVRQRDPAANAGEDRVLQIGEAATIDDSFAFDREGDPLIYDWQVTEKPAGSAPSLAGADGLHPTFDSTTPGVYVLSLSVSDGWLTGAADTVQIIVEGAPCTGQTHISITNHDVVTDESYEACVEIVVGPDVRVDNQAKLTLAARSQICFDSGFTVESGSELAASNDPLAGS